ncbi:MAG TPA: ribonuclease H-like domain-containing protein [Candidatus Paceibacterota bacterium]|nr:ribonuclease H-like domain-containing protein [Candidatus Paceibacterota bacterium]
MKRITFDIETVGAFASNGDFSNLEITVVGTHDSETGELKGFFKEDFPQMWKLFESADVLVSYNGDHFDIPILNKYYAGDLGKIKSVDLLKEVREVLGRRLKLQSIAEATLGRGKSSDGLEAMDWWAQGKKDEVMKYCLDDVKLTNEIYEYAKKNGSLKYKDYEGIREIKLDTSNWEVLPENQLGMTHTLPF